MDDSPLNRCDFGATNLAAFSFPFSFPLSFTFALATTLAFPFGNADGCGYSFGRLSDLFTIR